MRILSESIKNAVLADMAQNLDDQRNVILEANALDLRSFDRSDRAMYDRLVVTDKHIDGMIKAVEDIMADDDPVGRERYAYDHDNGLRVVNRTTPFGTILIIYESRPDVTIEAASVAFKSGNRILLKGGKEARNSNLALMDCWQKALTAHGLEATWITYLNWDRQKTQDFIADESNGVDLIVPRGGEGLIRFVQDHASCPVLVSGRGNNFLYVHRDANWDMALRLIKNAKTHKISACNALDKVLIDSRLPAFDRRLKHLIAMLKDTNVEILLSEDVHTPGPEAKGTGVVTDEDIWYEEFLAMKIVIGQCKGIEEAIELINRYSGGHSVSIVTDDEEVARRFMEGVDAAAVYHNASTRFTDGGQFGIGAEMAISTDKLHHRGPLGLAHLVTNKWYVYGNGQIRE